MGILPVICAISSPPGCGGLAVLRVSGSGVYEVCDRVVRLNIGKRVGEIAARKLFLGTVYSEGEEVDQVLVCRYVAPHSYTGEDTVEIQCHGSVYIQQEILGALIQAGASLAQAGEFTQRAFLNGKLNLTEAEAIGDLISSESRAEHRLAYKQMKGGISAEIQRLREQLLEFTALLELELDFSDQEGLEFANREQLWGLLNKIEGRIGQLCRSFKAGNAVKQGIAIAIVGATNAGKSTLLNTLIGDDRAIVSNIAGTTRDTLEESFYLNGYKLRLIDTAGLRETDDSIERLGIERTLSSIEKADIVLVLVDAQAYLKTKSLGISFEEGDKSVIVLFNKVDLLSDVEREEIEGLSVSYPRVMVSAKEQIGIDGLLSQLQEYLPQVDSSDTILCSMRHYQALSKAGEVLRTLSGNFENNISQDLLSQDLRLVLDYLAEITGEIRSEEVLGEIFSRFCIGK